MIGKLVVKGKNLTTDFNGEQLSLDDRVTWSMTFGCGNCFFCKKGLPQKCVKMYKYGHVRSDKEPHFTGGFAKYVHLKKGSYIFKVSSDLTDEEKKQIDDFKTTLLVTAKTYKPASVYSYTYSISNELVGTGPNELFVNFF